MKAIAIALSVCAVLTACGHRDRSATTAKNLVEASKAQTAIGMARADVTKLLGTPYYGDDLEWHYYSTDPASGKEVTCFIYFKADTGIVRDVGCH